MRATALVGVPTGQPGSLSQGLGLTLGAYSAQGEMGADEGLETHVGDRGGLRDSAGG